MKLSGIKILLGITGSIAAYKSVLLLRLLLREGAEVRVLLTPFAEKFVTKGTLAALSGNPVLSEFFKSDGTWNSHVDMGAWADLFVIAPLTANTMAKMVHGQADNLLVATYLSAKCPVVFAPAMDLDMYRHKSTQSNVSQLQAYGNILIEPVSGELASGLYGKGRMQEPEAILPVLSEVLTGSAKKKLISRTILITAGPTFEPLDPVRYIGNRSSGKMGYAIAEACAELGAEVILVSGPVNIRAFHPSITTIPVETASEMYEAAVEAFKNTDIAILTAAVSDFTPETSFTKKVKRGDDDLTLRMKPTKDIAAELGRMKKDQQFIVGFALETDHEMENARRKLEVKNLDFIVLNSLNDEGAGFQTDTNRITIIDKNNIINKFELKSKKEVALDIVGKIAEMMISMPESG